VRFTNYRTSGSFDELFAEDGAVRPAYQELVGRLSELGEDEFERRRKLTDLLLRNQGVTFTVYSDDQGIEKVFPFDPIPRLIAADEWERVERGLVQRIEALNLFLQDVYHEQKILRDKVIEPELVFGATFFRREMMGFDPPRGVYTHVVGTDLIRDEHGEFLVLEDNARNPSGVSYVLGCRPVMKRVFPRLFEHYGVRTVTEYPSLLRETLTHVAPPGSASPTIALLTPGVYNSAYFEHSYLSREMGIPLVEGRDLVIKDGAVCMRTTHGLTRVDVLYSRIDDDFIDPVVFRKDSMLGCAGLFSAYRGGMVTLCNAPGTGVADDKAVYPYVPDMIKYYLDQDPILPNVKTYIAAREADRKYILEHLPELVVKQTDASGGYGMMIGPKSTREEHEQFRERILQKPRSYIAQPTIQLGTHPTVVDGGIEARCVDLRPYVLYGDRVRVVPGGLTRVALRRGSLVVNSSQGGGYKDTWVLAAQRAYSEPPEEPEVAE
jgi:uncharacterized circularly permuted ATP-grasp superfamily protein